MSELEKIAKAISDLEKMYNIKLISSDGHTPIGVVTLCDNKNYLYEDGQLLEE